MAAISKTNTGRFSTQLLEQHGAERKVQLQEGNFSNVYENGTGAETFSSPDTTVLGTSGLVPGAVNTNIFSAVYGYYQGRGIGTSQAKTLALLTIDSAKLQGVSPISLLEGISSGKVKFSNETIAAMNQLRSPSSQTARATNINNRQSNISASVKP